MYNYKSLKEFITQSFIHFSNLLDAAIEDEELFDCWEYTEEEIANNLRRLFTSDDVDKLFKDFYPNTIALRDKIFAGKVNGKVFTVSFIPKCEVSQDYGNGTERHVEVFAGKVDVHELKEFTNPEIEEAAEMLSYYF